MRVRKFELPIEVINEPYESPKFSAKFRSLSVKCSSKDKCAELMRDALARLAFEREININPVVSLSENTITLEFLDTYNEAYFV